MAWLNLQDNVNVLSLIGAAVIILATFIVVARMFAQMKEKRGEAELAEHSWDGIGEYKNPVPLGWSVVFFLAVVWMLWYFLWGYPLNSYSQIGEYNEEVQKHNSTFQQKFSTMSQEDKIAMGTNLFLVQCSPCHGITGDGINGKAQNLGIWGSEEFIALVVKNGSQGLGADAEGNSYLMPVMQNAADLGLSDDDVKAVAAYVALKVSAIKKTANEGLVDMGELVYTETCVTCHGEDGTGIIGGEAMAPDLTKYGSAAFGVEVLNRGKNGSIGSMPKFDTNILNDIQKEAVSEYVISLSRSE